MTKVIYDLGAHNGDDIPYYLKRADVVVAVEANPILCEQISRRFSSQISEKRLFLENVVVTTSKVAEEDVFFYIHRTNDVLSQFPVPQQLGIFRKIILPGKSIEALIREHGAPYYVKIDIEHYDSHVLRALFEAKIRPAYISAESHSIEVFSLMVALGGYSSFKLSDGPSVSRLYRHVQTEAGAAAESHSFPYHSAGPFGEDLIGSWLPPDVFFRILAVEGLGWKDIHATNVHEPDYKHAVHLPRLVLRKGWARARARIGHQLVSMRSSLK